MRAGLQDNVILFLIDGFFFKLCPYKISFLFASHDLKPKSFLDDGLNQIVIVSFSNKYSKICLIFGYIQLSINVIGEID